MALWYCLEQLEARGLHENDRVDYVSKSKAAASL